MTGESASCACQHATGAVPRICSSLCSPKQGENSRHVKTCCCLCCWGRPLLPGRKDGTEKCSTKWNKAGTFYMVDAKRCPKNRGWKQFLKAQGHKFKLPWVNESGGTGQKGNLETQTAPDQCLELPLKFSRRPFAHQSYKRSIHVATLILTTSFPWV